MYSEKGGLACFHDGGSNVEELEVLASAIDQGLV